MNIGIIGAGHIGGTLTRRFRTLGHDVSIANSRGPDTLKDIASETGAHAVAIEDAVRDKDLVVVTIPEKSILDLPKNLFADVPASTVIVDTGNYYPQRDGRLEGIESGTTESRWMSQQIERPAVKAFNNVYAQHLMERGKPKGTAGRIALPVAGDDPKAKQVAMDLVDALGFDPIDAGGLDDSWRQQPGTPVYGTDNDAEGVRKALSQASKERPKEFSAA